MQASVTKTTSLQKATVVGYLLITHRREGRNDSACNRCWFHVTECSRVGVQVQV